MKLAILGVGNVGSALARGWRRTGHQVLLGVRDPAKRDVVALAEQIGASVHSVNEAAQAASVIVLAVPWGSVDQALKDAGDLDGKVLIDCTNPIDMVDGQLGLTIGHATSGGEYVAERAKTARVVKTLNQAAAELLAENDELEGRPLMFVAGDDDDAKTTATALVRELGFDVHDAGDIRVSRLLEPLGMLWLNQAIYQNSGRNWAFGMVRRARGR
ncbi:MAG: NAD(P)-binding domain-containing protein [Pseudomonadota bacterium]